MKILITLLFVFLLNSLHAQTESDRESMQYEILVLGLKIGEMTAQKLPGQSDTLHYKVDSQVKFWFFGNVDLKFKAISKFLNQKIVKTHSESNTNRGDYLSKIVWTGNQYHVNAATYKYENQKPVKNQLSWCSNRMFFEEPKPGEMFLSEVYGTAQPIKQIEPGVYEVSVEGNTNRYYYKSGKLERIVLENPIKNYQVKRIR